MGLCNIFLLGIEYVEDEISDAHYGSRMRPLLFKLLHMYIACVVRACWLLRALTVLCVGPAWCEPGVTLA